MTKVLLVVAHPNIENSIANKTIVEHFVKLHKETELDELYKDDQTKLHSLLVEDYEEDDLDF